MYQRIRNYLSCRLKLRILLLFVTSTALLGGTAGWLVDHSLLLPLLVGATVGAVVAGLSLALHSVTARLTGSSLACCIACVCLAVLLGPVVTGFIAAFASRHGNGTPGVVAVGGVIVLAPPVMAAVYALIAAYYSRRHSC